MIEPNLGLGILNEMFSIKGNELSEEKLEENFENMKEWLAEQDESNIITETGTIDVYPEYFYDTSSLEKSIDNLDKTLKTTSKYTVRSFFDTYTKTSTPKKNSESTILFSLLEDQSPTLFRTALEALLNEIIEKNLKNPIKTLSYTLTKKLVNKTSADKIDETIYGTQIYPYVVDTNIELKDSDENTIALTQVQKLLGAQGQNQASTIADFFSPITNNYLKNNYTNFIDLNNNNSIVSFSESIKPVAQKIKFQIASPSASTISTAEYNIYYYEKGTEITINPSRFLISQKKEQAIESVFYPNLAWIGLFTKMPNSKGLGFEEVTAPEYTRLDLHRGIYSEKHIFRINLTEQHFFDFLVHYFLGEDSTGTIGEFNAIFPDIVKTLGISTKNPEQSVNGLSEDIKQQCKILMSAQNYDDNKLQQSIYDTIKDFTYPIDSDVFEHEGKGKIDNNEIIIFPEITTAIGWGTIVGFGMFESQTPQVNEKPFFWSQLKDPKGTSQGQVPLFRPNEFKILLG